MNLFQSIGDGGQGWCNAILYILFSPNIRRRLVLLLSTPFLRCVRLVHAVDGDVTIQHKKDERKMEKSKLTIEL